MNATDAASYSEIAGRYSLMSADHRGLAAAAPTAWQRRDHDELADICERHARRLHCAAVLAYFGFQLHFRRIGEDVGESLRAALDSY